MRRADEAIVIDTRPLSEADVVVTVLTRGHGVVRGVARAARRSRRRFGGALEPMAHVTLRWSEREGRELQSLESAEIVRSFSSMQAEPAVQAACAVVGETLARSAPHPGDDDRVFRLALAALDALARQEPVLAVVRYFEAWYLRLHGMSPDPDRCAQCGRGVVGSTRLARADGSPRCRECAGRTELARASLADADREALRALWGGPPRGLDPLAERCHAGGALETLLRGGVEHYVERSLRAYRHLNEMTVTRPQGTGVVHRS